MQRHVLLFIALFVLLFGCSIDAGSDADFSEQQPGDTSSKNEITWGVVSSSMQLITESLDPTVCPSGWTALKSDLERDNNGHLPPLQKDYVKRFESLYDFSKAAGNARAVLNDQVKVIRLSTLWPCWMTPGSTWAQGMDQTVFSLQEAGWTVELSLLQRDSYPDHLHSGDGFKLGGWTNTATVGAFVAYTESVLDVLKDRLPRGTRIYLGNEPVSALFAGYLDRDGKWPPGGKNAGSSLADALINMRDAFRESANLIALAGFSPAISVNIRPLSTLTIDQSPRVVLLDRLRNWWLLDALAHGCNDDNFDGDCGVEINGSLDTVGLTYYGTMLALEESVDVGPGLQMARDGNEFVPDHLLFGSTLEKLDNRYPNLTIGISEIGFSSGSVDKMEDWLAAYVLEARLSIPADRLNFIQIHTLFESAEFSAGEWFFHIADGCDPGTPCSLTPWGERFLKVVSEQ